MWKCLGRRLYLACLILLSLPTRADSDDFLSNLKNDAYFLMSPGSKSFFRRLQKTPWPFADVDEKSVEDLMARLNDRTQDEYKLSWSVFHTRRRSSVLEFAGAGQRFVSEATRPVLVAAVRGANNRIAGFFAVTFLKTQDNEREAYIDYIVAPNGNGLAGKILTFIRQEFSMTFRLRALYAELEWSGREYWARPEFGFRFSPLQPGVIFDGRKIKYDVLVLFNFLAFMRLHQVRESDLCLQLTNGEQMPFDLDYTTAPSLLRCVRKRDGQRINVDVLKSSNNVQRRLLHFGHGFLVTDHQPRNGQLIRVRMGGIDYSDAAMPPWFGVTDPCEDLLED